MRDRVVAALTAVGGVEVDVLVVETAGVPDGLRDEVRFSPECAERLLAPVFARSRDPSERVVVVTDRLPLERTTQGWGTSTVRTRLGWWDGGWCGRRVPRSA